MRRNKFFNIMMDLAFEAGGIALKFLGKAKPTLKADHSIVTLADTKISWLVRKKLAKFLSNPQHILIDEEDPHVSKYLDSSILKKTKYIWSVDPIDGTRNYANQIPSFGISIGLLKNLKPWMGVVYFPVLRELFFHDGNEAYFVQNPRTKEEKQKVIRPVHVEVSNRTYFLATDTFFKKFEWDHKDCRIMIQSCAAVELCWPSIGRGCGSLIKSSLWDFAGSWPIIEAAGFKLRSLQQGKQLDCIDINSFDPNIPWRMNDFYIICDKENFSVIKNKIYTK